ncbi:MAG: alanine racemase [Caldiserica bacterium]|nr:alanine racemase [Caldisericota bacterium]
MYRPTVAEIDLGAIRENLRAIRACIPLRTQVIGVVKADAYGHGAARVAAVLEQEQVPLLAVATPDEAVELREAGIMTEILVLGHAPPDFVPFAVSNNVTLTTDAHATTAMYASAAGSGRVRLHYKIDTGMGRAGVPADTATGQIMRSFALPNVDIVGLYSHLASAESDLDFTARQTECFADIVRDVRAGGLRPAMVHLANSAGIFTVHAPPLDGVRPGILLYGLPPVASLAQACAVKPSLSLRTRLEVVKDLPAGHGIGYGRTFVTERPTRMGLIPIGYADGYPRSLSNKASVIVRGQFAPIVGRVSMDVVAIDVTDVPAAVPGDPVTLIGEQDGLAITAVQLAEMADTISYEIVTGVSKRVPRIYIDRQP